jgi:hypothetical protein
MNVNPPEVEGIFGHRLKNGDLGEKWLYKASRLASFRAPVGTRNRLTSNHFTP